MELNGRIKESFGLEGSAVKVTPDQTLSNLALIIQKALRQAEASAVEDGQVEAGEQQEESNEDAAVGVGGKNRTDIFSLVENEFEEEKQALPHRHAPANASSPDRHHDHRHHHHHNQNAKLVIGANEFVGAHITRYLLKKGASLVYCVVNAMNSHASHVLIKKTMEELGLWKDNFDSHLIALPGDMTKANFGLKEEQYSSMLMDVDAIIVSGGHRSVSGDETHSQANTAAAINAVSFARRGGASLHYVTSGWVDPFDSEEGEAEEVLKVASQRYNIDCSSYRLPFMTVNSKGGVMAGDHIIFDIIKACCKTGVVSQDWERSSLPLLPADVAGKFVVRGVESTGHKSQSRGEVCVRDTMALNAYMPMSTLLGWVDQLADKPLSRGVEYSKVVIAFSQALKDHKENQGLIHNILSKDRGEILAKATTHHTTGLSVREVVDVVLHRPNRDKVVGDLKRYIDDHPEVVAVAGGDKRGKRFGGEEEEVKEADEMGGFGRRLLSPPHVVLAE